MQTMINNTSSFNPMESNNNLLPQFANVAIQLLNVQNDFLYYQSEVLPNLDNYSDQELDDIQEALSNLTSKQSKLINQYTPMIEQMLQDGILSSSQLQQAQKRLLA